MKMKEVIVKTKTFPGLLLAAMLMLPGVARPAAAQSTLVDLGTLSGTSANPYDSSSALAINDRGQVIGTSAIYDADHNYKGYHAFLYANGQMNDLGALGGTDPYGNRYSYPVAINGAGQVVGWFEIFDADHNDKGAHAFLYA